MIDFRCQQCGKLLRTPDEAAGKMAKCPACQTVQPIPQAGATPPSETAGVSPFGSAPAGGGNPFATAGTPYAQPSLSGDAANPYAAPMPYDTRIQPGTAEAAAIVPTRMDPLDVLRRAWEIYKSNMLLCIGGVFCALILNYTFQFMTSFIGTLTSGLAGGGNATMVVAQIFQALLANLFSFWISVGMILFLVRIARGQSAALTDLFAGGPYLLRMIGASLLIGFAIGGASLVCLAPGLLLMGIAGANSIAAILALIVGGVVVACLAIYVGLAVSQYQFLIVDRNVGVIESLQLSRTITTDNKLAIVVLGILGIGIMLLGVLALCVGVFVALPLIYLAGAVAYLVMTGQPTAEMLHASPPAAPTA